MHIGAIQVAIYARDLNQIFKFCEHAALVANPNPLSGAGSTEEPKNVFAFRFGEPHRYQGQ